MKSPLSIAFCFFVAISSVACSSGGGGSDDPFSPGGSAIEADPTSIDTGERSTITVQLADPNPRGVVLKIRFSTQLSYVNRSSTILVNGNEIRRDPDEKGTSAADSKYYLVFVLTPIDFGDASYLELKLFVHGDTATVSSSSSSGSTSSSGASTDARIEVDADLVDPAVDDQFDISAPDFTAEDGASVEIR